ncbi:hypothetical protein IFT43_20425 [Oxalobacteraceae sp. CFBP 13708]|nr:hypothetical protein [Oxalobacteraceae sp. CFBP 13708]
MPYDLYDYLDAAGVNLFAGWTTGLEKIPRAKMKSKIDMLRLHGEELFPEVLTDTHVRGIRKIRIKGNVQLRPLLCRGPHGLAEYTFLMGAKEVGDKFDPKDAPEVADARKSTVAKDISRRCKHE